MAGQRLLPNPARLTQQKQPPNHTIPPRPHTPSSLPCPYANRTPNASAPKHARMTRRLQKLLFVPFADQKEAAAAVLPASPRPSRGQKRNCKCRSPWPSVSSVDKRCCSCRSPWSSVALRGQKVLPLQFFAVLRVPSWKKKLPLQLPFSVSLRRQNKLQHTKCHQKRPVQNFPQWPYYLQLQPMSIPSETKNPQASQKPRRRPPTRVNHPR